MVDKKKDNRGAALVTVLVVTTFIVFMATTLMYASSMNYQQKQTDYQNKQSFYGAEQALDTLRSLLVEDVQEAYVEAYADTAAQFILLGSSDARSADFTDGFNEALLDIWSDRLNATSDGKMSTAVQNFMAAGGVDEDIYKCVYDTSTAGVYKINESTNANDEATSDQKFVLRGVRVKYTYGNYTTFLYTDICIEAPSLDWSSDASDGSGDAISFTDCISYINWQRIDYDYDVGDEYDNIDVGTASGTVTYTSPTE